MLYPARASGPGGPFIPRIALLPCAPGKYPYKFVVDGNWTYSIDHPTIQDGNNINNVLDVRGGGEGLGNKVLVTRGR